VSEGELLTGDGVIQGIDEQGREMLSFDLGDVPRNPAASADRGRRRAHRPGPADPRAAQGVGRVGAAARRWGGSLMTTTGTKRSHFIPVTYLRAWANDSEQVAARRRDTTKVYSPNVINVAVEAGLYGSGAVGQSREELFCSLEETWPRLRDALTRRGGEVEVELRSEVSLFAAIQLVRTRESIALAEFTSSFAGFSARRPASKDDMRAFLAEHWLKFPPSDTEVEAAWAIALAHQQLRSEPLSRDEAISVLLKVAIDIVPRLAALHWVVEHCREPMLFTSDRPVMCWRPRSPRDGYEGIGIENAEEIRMPLTPHDLLIMRPFGVDGGIDPVPSQRFERVNAAVASQCHDLVVAAPSRMRELQVLPMATHRPVLRFNMASGVRVTPDGRGRWKGHIKVHYWVPAHADDVETNADDGCAK
jgi:hypothetical protein